MCSVVNCKNSDTVLNVLAVCELYPPQLYKERPHVHQALLSTRRAQRHNIYHQCWIASCRHWRARLTLPALKTALLAQNVTRWWTLISNAGECEDRRWGRHHKLSPSVGDKTAGGRLCSASCNIFCPHVRKYILIWAVSNRKTIPKLSDQRWSQELRGRNQPPWLQQVAHRLLLHMPIADQSCCTYIQRQQACMRPRNLPL